MSGSSNLDSFRDGWWMAVQLLLCGVEHPGLVQCCELYWTKSKLLGRKRMYFYEFIVAHLNSFLEVSLLWLMSRVFTNGPGDLGSILGRLIPKTQKWYLIPPCLTLSIIRYRSMVKWSNPRTWVAPSPTPWCSSYWKGSLRITLDYGRQLYFLLTITTTFSIFHCIL